MKHGVFFPPPNSFLAISSQLPWTAISKTRPNSWQLTQINSSATELSQRLKTHSNHHLCPFITPRHGPQRKHSLYCYRSGLLIRCLAIDVLFLRALARVGICLLSRCLAKGIHVTILSGSRKYPVVDSCQHSDKPSSTIKISKSFDQPSDYRLLKLDCTLWSNDISDTT
jgi:hypothetical protein